MKKIMMKKVLLLIVSILIANSFSHISLQAQTKPPEGAPVIEFITSNSNCELSISIKALKPATKIWVETNPNQFLEATVNDEYPIERMNFQVSNGILKIYGDITGVDCSGTKEKRAEIAKIDAIKCAELRQLDCSYNNISELNVTGLTKLKTLKCSNNQLEFLSFIDLTNLVTLWCEGNKLSGQAMDEIFCQLPIRIESDSAIIYTLFNNKDTNWNNVMNANHANATKKKWTTKYVETGKETEVSVTYYVCSPPPDLPIHEFNTRPGAEIILNMTAEDNKGTPVWVEVSPKIYKYLRVYKEFSYQRPAYKILGDKCIIYGDITALSVKGSNYNPGVLSMEPSTNSNLETLIYALPNAKLYFDGLSKLKYFECQYISRPELDLSCLPLLKEVKCNNSNIGKLNLRGLRNLDILDCSSNQITSIDLSGATNLQSLDCSKNSLTNLNLAGATNLQSLNCSENNLNTLELNEFKKLTYLSCYSNKLSKLDFSAITNVNSIKCANNQIEYLDFSGLQKLTNFDCNKNKLTDLNISGLSSLKEFSCNYNPIKKLTCSNLPNLYIFYCIGNLISEISINAVDRLRWIFCADNKMTTRSLDELYCQLPFSNDAFRTGIVPIYDLSDPNYPIVKATNGSNAEAKNWYIRYPSQADRWNVMIPPTTGDYVCEKKIGIDLDGTPRHSLRAWAEDGKLNINIENNTSKIYQIDVFNTLGEVVYSNSIQFGSLCVDNLIFGVYFVRIGNYIQKVLILR